MTITGNFITSNAAAAAESPADTLLREQREEVRAETAAMAAAYDVLQPLGEEARHRALRWLWMALDLSPRVPF
jgi:hypothetical protein